MAHCSLEHSAHAENPFYHPVIAFAYLAEGVAVIQALGSLLTWNPPMSMGRRGYRVNNTERTFIPLLLGKKLDDIKGLSEEAF